MGHRYLTVVIDHDTGKVVRCAEAKWSLATDALRRAAPDLERGAEDDRRRRAGRASGYAQALRRASNVAAERHRITSVRSSDTAFSTA